MSGAFIRRLVVLLALVSLLQGRAHAIQSRIEATEYNALVNLYDTTGGTNWWFSPGWGDPTASEWYGVSIDDGHVVRLDLKNRNLTGTIPESLASLSRLQSLDLSENNLEGGIPGNLSSLTDLWALNLSSNELEGEFPEFVTGLSNLVRLELDNNRLTGEISDNLPALPDLRYLYLSNNALHGEIPPNVGQLANLEELSFSSNNLVGRIPETLGNLSRLRYLYLSGNHFSGQIPTILGTLPDLRLLILGGNNLTGDIPSNIEAMPRLSWLSLKNNYLNDAIASEGWAQIRTTLKARGVLVQDTPQKPAPAGMIEWISGEVWRITSWGRQQLFLGGGVAEGDVIETGEASSIRMVFTDGSILTAGRDTLVQIEKFEQDSSGFVEALHSLSYGLIRLISGGNETGEKDIKVRTPSTTIGVRGTDFTVEYVETNGVGTTTVAVESGLVELTNEFTGGTTAIGPGESGQAEAPLAEPEVRSYGVVKSAVYFQTGALSPQLHPEAAFELEAQVEGLTSASVTEASVTPPGHSPLPLKQEWPWIEMWETNAAFPDQTSLDIAFPNGAYMFDIVTAEGMDESVLLQLEGDSYPTAPHLTNYNEAQQIDPEEVFWFEWDAFVEAKEADYISLEVEDQGYGQTVFTSGQLPADATTLEVPGGTLEFGGVYLVRITFHHRTDRNSEVFWLGAAGYSSKTSVEVRTISGSGLPNDDFADATVIAGSIGSVSGSNEEATREAGEPEHAGSGLTSVWWRWTAPADGPVVVNTFGSDFDTVLAVYTGTLADLTEVVANDDDETVDDYTSRVEFAAVAGAVYHIAVSGFYDDIGEFVLNWEMPDGGEEPSGFAAWAGVLPPELRGESDDPGGPGIPNLLRYAFDMDPLQPDRADLPTLAREVDGEGAQAQEYLVISFRRRKQTSDLSYALEAADKPGHWTSLSSPAEITDDGNGETETVTFRDSEPTDNRQSRFLRVRVER